jgi:hypothetical protein
LTTCFDVLCDRNEGTDKFSSAAINQAASGPRKRPFAPVNIDVFMQRDARVFARDRNSQPASQLGTLLGNEDGFAS